MRYFLPILIAMVPFFSRSQPGPLYEATTNQVVAGIVGAPFYVSPRDLKGAGIIPTTDPLSLSQINAGILWATNMITPTNAFAGAIVDFSKAESTTNLSGTLTFTGVSNLSASGNNSCVLHGYSGGSERLVAVPASWHIGRGCTLVVSNTFNHSDFFFTCQPGVSTNVAQIDYP